MNHIIKATQLASIFFMALVLGLFSLNLSAQTTDTGWMTNPQHPPVQTRFVLTGQNRRAGDVQLRPSGEQCAPAIAVY